MEAALPPEVDVLPRLRRHPPAFSPDNEAPCRSECLKLLTLADAITAANPAFASAFAGWHDQVNALLDGNDLETLEAEANIESLSMSLRRIWLGIAHSFADIPLKSPPYLDEISFPLSRRTKSFVYERVMAPGGVEGRLQKLYPPVPGWESQFCLFSSAMGALTVLLQVLPRFLRKKDSMPRWDACIGYFETERLLRLHGGRGMYIRSYREPAELYQRVAEGKTDIMLVEPSMYDWKQSVLDPGPLVKAILERPKDRPLALVLDTTLLGSAFRAADLLACLDGSCPLLAVEVRSGLKMDQEGLELSNVGIVRLFSRKGGEAGMFGVERWHRHMRSARKIFGNAVSLDEMSILDVPWFSDPARLDSYMEPIFANNARLAAELAGVQGGLFARIAHPSLTELAEWQWGQSPFVIAHLHTHEDRTVNRELLKSVIHHEVQKRGLVVYLAASFGFRHHRFEIVIPEGYERPDGGSISFLKVAMGHRAGPSCEGLIALLREIAAYPSFEALRKRYPDLKPLAS